MNDAFCEQLVPRKTDLKDVALLILSIAATLLLTTILTNFIGSFSILLFVAAAIAIWYYLVPRLKKEYEYYLLNYTLEVSLIQNKANRNSVIEFDIRKAEIVAPTGSSSLNTYRTTKSLDFTSGVKGAATYTIIVPIERDVYRIMIEPDENITEQMKLWLGPKML